MEIAPRKIAQDVADRAHQMPRGSTLLFRNKTPKDDTSSHYRGVIKMQDGTAYWVGLWVRELAGERVLEVKFSPKL